MVLYQDSRSESVNVTKYALSNKFKSQTFTILIPNLQLDAMQRCSNLTFNSDAIQSCSNETITNGRLANYKVESSAGDSASLVCNDGYATYNPHLICGDDNTWVPTPICHKG